MISRALQRIRNIAFWSIDSICGGVVRKAYQDIKRIDNMDSRSEYILKYQEFMLDKLIKHAIETTNYYKNRRYQEFTDFPIVDKNIIKENQTDFLSNKYINKKLVTMSTSGSTGTPFICYQNIEKKKRVYAEIIYYSEKAGYSVGSSLIFLRAITEKNQKSKLQQWLQNETLLDVKKLDDKKIANLLIEIERVSHNGSMILAYASTYDALKDYFKRHNISVAGKSNITGMVSGSEMLFDDTRETIEKVFKCRCFSRYSNQENGVIGQDEKLNNIFILNEANYLVEIFKMDENKPAAEGEVGRIIITDLYNYAMPMIRYDTGDIGSLIYIERNGIKKKAIADFGGRKVDIVFDCSGNRLSPHSITNEFWSFPEIKQFQFIQVGETSYTVKINVDEFNRKNELKSALLKLLGHEANITIEKVDEIPIMSSGKRKYIIPFSD